MTTVRRWTGREATALRAALRQSLRDFAAHLGVGIRTVSKWEAGGTKVCPRPEMQAVLDTALSRAEAEAQAHFVSLLEEDLAGAPTQGVAETQASANSAAERHSAHLAATAWTQLAGTNSLYPLIPTGIVEDGDPVDRRQLLQTIGAGSMIAVRHFVLAAAHSSALLSSTAEAAGVGPALLDDARADLHRLATDYVTTVNLTPIVNELVMLRDRLFSTLTERRQRPADLRELHLLLGASCIVLASISHDLEEPQAGLMQARSAQTFARLAGDPALLTWVHCTKAMIASWWGSPFQVLAHAEQARTDGACGVGAVRLAGLEARAMAELGRGAEAVALLQAAQSDRETLNNQALANLGEVFSFPLSRQYYYEAATYARLGHWNAVEQQAGKVLALSNTPVQPGCWPVTWALSRIYLAQARLETGGPEGAADALSPVFAVPTEQRIPQVFHALDALTARLCQPVFATLPAAEDLAAAIRAFRPAHAGGSEVE